MKSALLLFTLPALAAAALTVSIKSATDYCLVVPKFKNTAIGASEYPGGMTVWCAPGKKSEGSTGNFKGQFWQPGRVSITKPKEGVIQMTGCINVTSSDRLQRGDGGGQYDSNGGEGGRGNPQGSKCAGYNSYVELIEPDVNRACIRCCKNASDCPLNYDTAGCPKVIPGKYFNCA